MLTRDEDGRALVKWVDLGTAQVLAMSDGLPAGAGIFPARPKYASPEQFSAAGEGTVDARGDLYSFGVVLYELLTGRCPIAGKDPFSLMVGHLSTPPVPFAESDPEGRVPGEVREIVLSTLAKKPEERIASADELARRLASLQDPLADDRGEYLDRVLQRAHQKTAVVILPPPPPPAPVAEPETVEEPPLPTPVAALALVELPPMEPPPAPPPLSEPPRVAEPARDPRSAGPQWDQLDMAAFATQALRVDPVIPSEATRRTLLEPLPAPTTPAAAAAPIVASPAGPSTSRPILIGVGAGVLAALLIGAGWWLGGSHRPAPAPAPDAATPDASTPETTAAPSPAPPPTVEVKPESSPRREKARRPEEAPAGAPVSRPAERRAERKAAAEEPALAAKGLDAEVPPPSPPGRGRLITGGPGVESAEVTALGAVVYPERARGTGRKVTIKVAVLVDENGNVAEVRIKEGDPSGLGFNEAARDAARRTRFLPATQDGVPGKSWTDLNFEFVEGSGGSPPA